MSGDPEGALDIVDQLGTDRRLQSYHLLPAVRGDLLEKLDRGEEAAEEFSQAAAMTGNEQERRVLEARAEKAKEFAGCCRFRPRPFV